MSLFALNSRLFRSAAVLLASNAKRPLREFTARDAEPW
jgi:hypothetical protein